ncbi:MAG: sigma-70 family RNA polymerase sigma factor [Balneolaceae bacterium]
MSSKSGDENGGVQRKNASRSSVEDEKLLERAAAGDESASARLVEKYRKSLIFHIRGMVKEAEEVEDLVQESFVKVFENLANYNPEYAFSTWLYRIATNHTIDFLRRKKLQTFSIDRSHPGSEGDEATIQLPAGGEEADRHVIKKERRRMVREAIAALPEKYRQVIELRHMEELSYDEISDQLDMPLGTVKAHIFRARELLYKSMKDKRDRF